MVMKKGNVEIAIHKDVYEVLVGLSEKYAIKIDGFINGLLSHIIEDGRYEVSRVLDMLSKLNDDQH